MSNSIYANGIAKAQFNYLLGKPRLLRMIESTQEDALKILSEVNFGEGANCQSPLEFEKILYLEEKKLLSMIRSSCSSDAFSDYFLLPYDYHNAEAIIKAKYLKKDAEKMLVCHGKFESSLLMEKIFNDDYKIFPKQMKDALLTADSYFVGEKATGENISTIFKKALYSNLFECAKKNKILSNIFSFKVDMQNVSSAFRTKDFEQMKNLFLQGGNISENEIKNLCTQSIDIVKEKIKFYAHGEVIEKAIDNVENNIPFSEFENICDSYTVSMLKKQKYSIDGIVPFMLYCYYRINEIKNVRIIMVGLINGLDKQQIERRIRDCYEG